MDIEYVRSRFIKHFDGTTGAVYASPGRINLIGEHTDYNGGFVFPGAIDKGMIAEIKPNGTNTVKAYSIDLKDYVEFGLNEEDAPRASWARYIFGVCREMIKRGVEVKGFNTAFAGDVPLGAGMSSSAALESTYAYALNDLFGDNKIDKFELAKVGQARLVAQVVFQIPEGLCKLHPLILPCLGKLHIGGIRAAVHKLRNARGGVLPCDYLRAAHILRAPAGGDVDAVYGVPRGKLALRRLKAVAAVKGALQQRGNVLRGLLLLERGGNDHAGIVLVHLVPPIQFRRRPVSGQRHIAMYRMGVLLVMFVQAIHCRIYVL